VGRAPVAVPSAGNPWPRVGALPQDG